jgi:hypothetical protein
VGCLSWLLNDAALLLQSLHILAQNVPPCVLQTTYVVRECRSSNQACKWVWRSFQMRFLGNWEMMGGEKRLPLGRAFFRALYRADIIEEIRLTQRAVIGGYDQKVLTASGRVT